MRTLVMAAVAPAALVALAGCADDSGEARLSKDRWIEQADEICEEEKSELGDLETPPADPFDEMLTPTQLEEIADYLRASLEIQDRATGRLDGLGLPDDDADDIEDVLEHRAVGKRAVEAAIEGARAGDADRFTRHYRRAVTDYGRASQAAREFGLEECGQP
jgi:hypothetical protein